VQCTIGRKAWARKSWPESLGRKTASIDQCCGLTFGWGRRPSSQQADDPCRAIEIVARRRVNSTRRTANARSRPHALLKKCPAHLQSRSRVKRLTFPLAGVRYVALPSSSGPPEHPKGAGGLGTRPQRGEAVAFLLLEMAESLSAVIQSDRGRQRKAALLLGRCDMPMHRQQRSESA
jgi:hypothetical protein